MALIPVKRYGFDDRRTIKTMHATGRPQTTINLLTPATASEATIGALGAAENPAACHRRHARGTMHRERDLPDHASRGGLPVWLPGEETR